MNMTVVRKPALAQQGDGEGNGDPTGFLLRIIWQLLEVIFRLLRAIAGNLPGDGEEVAP